MSGYLIDTNIISTSAPANAARHQAVLDWLEANTDLLFLSVVSVAEIESGIANSLCKGARRKAALAADWLESVLHLYGRRVLPLDIVVARAAGRLNGYAGGAGVSPGSADVAIAATASAQGLTIVTRNLQHFQPLGVPVLDPFDGSLP